jgi:hypothetical protein
MKAPKEPKEGIEHDFRQSPTRISAKRYGGSWMLYEKNPLSGRERILGLRPEWDDVYTQGTLLTRALSGRTLEQGVVDGIIEGPLQ